MAFNLKYVNIPGNIIVEKNYMMHLNSEEIYMMFHAVGVIRSR